MVQQEVFAKRAANALQMIRDPYHASQHQLSDLERDPVPWCLHDGPFSRVYRV
jgi:hypothetical protein